MLLEAVDCPIRYQWPEGEIRLTPGQPVSIPTDRGLKILKKCGPNVRHVQPDWLGAWRHLAQLTDGITKDDPRFFSVCDALEGCDRAWEQDDWPTFQQSVDRIKAIVSRSP